MSEAPGAHDPNFLPPDIPAPQDDGAARHLAGMKLPDIALPATSGPDVNLSKLNGRTVLYVYPRTGVPGVDLPPGWNEIPGARGCTPQSCGFRDHFAELRGARRRSALRLVDTGQRLPARSGGTAASAIRNSVGCGSEADAAPWVCRPSPLRA